MAVLKQRSEGRLPERHVLKVEGLGVSMVPSGTPLVDDISFAVRPGCILGLVGESGCGKTTASMALLGYARRGLRISSGSVLLDDVDVLKLGKSDMRGIRGRHAAYVPQDPSSALNPCLRIGAQLREALKVHQSKTVLRDEVMTMTAAEMDARIRELMAEVQLPDTDEFLARYPHQLSGGQKQRVTIAMAFSCRPELILLDEPTTGLDVSTQRHILETLRRLTSQYGTAGVYVSHDLAVVSQVSDHVAVMYAGRIVEMGPTADVMRTPRHPYTAGLLGAVPIPESRTCLEGIDGLPPRPGRWPRGCSFASRCEYADAACLSQLPALEDVGLTRVRCLRPLAGGDRAKEGAKVPDVGTRDERNALFVRGLDCYYGDKHVLKKVTFEAKAGLCTGVVGESGSGKTTLAQCLVGLHGSWTGDVRFDGRQLPTTAARRTNADRQRIQYVFQNPYTALNPRWTVYQIIEEPLRHFTHMSTSERRAQVRRVLEDVCLEEQFVCKYPDQLSGGENQRVAIARALVTEPTVLICDEVTSALDVSVQAVVIEMLRRLQIERGLSMVFITHNLALVESIAQRVVVLHQGSVVEDGPVQDVLSNPQDPYTVRLLSDAPRLQAEASCLDRSLPAVH